MRNCLILGAGRSGTSMLAGSLKRAGYYMGEGLLPSNPANPMGFFEAPEINRINEELLASVIAFKPSGPLGRLYRSRPGWGQGWLVSVPLGTEIPCPPSIARRITAQTSRAPFCLKDPRFSYTLEAWRPYLGDTVFLCVFREPSRTAASILKECHDAPYLHSLSMDFSRAVEIWTLMYRHILQIHQHHGEWLFVHYDQILDGSARQLLEAALGVALDREFPDPRLKRSLADQDPGAAACEVYEALCALAGYVTRGKRVRAGIRP